MANKHWLLDCEPRVVQLEANARSYFGVSVWAGRDNRRKEPVRVGPARATGYALFMEMRLGKTAALLNEFLLYKRDTGIRQLLVLAPNKYKYAWKQEAERFGVKEPVYVFESEMRAAANFYAPKVSIMVVNYEALQYEDNMKILRRFVGPDTMVAADESVLIKNRNTHAFKNGLELARRAPVVRILTGKPVVQGPHDLWSQLRFIRQLDGFNFYAFRNTFCKMGGFMGKQIVGLREENADRLRQEILQPCAFVAQRSEWGTNFEPDYQTRDLVVLPEQKKHYREMEQDFITFLQSGLPVTADQVITKHIKLQQISSGFIIDENKKVHELVPPEIVPKLVELKQALGLEISHKAIVIAFYVHSVETLLAQLSDYQPALIAGNLMMKRWDKDVEAEKKRFNSDPKCRILIGQIQAVKYGHNLMSTAKDPCNTIFYYENTYSLDDRSQSEQRPQGEGQTCGTLIVDFASTKVEREIIRALQRKEQVSQRILNAYPTGAPESVPLESA